MNHVIIRGHQLKVTEGIKNHAENKANHVLLHAKQAIRVDVTVAKEGHSPTIFSAKGHIVIWGPDMHVTAKNEDLYIALDQMAEKLDRMIRRKRRRLKCRRHLLNHHFLERFLNPEPTYAG